MTKRSAGVADDGAVGPVEDEVVLVEEIRGQEPVCLEDVVPSRLVHFHSSHHIMSQGCQ